MEVIRDEGVNEKDALINGREAIDNLNCSILSLKKAGYDTEELEEYRERLTMDLLSLAIDEGQIRKKYI